MLRKRPQRLANVFVVGSWHPHCVAAVPSGWGTRLQSPSSHHALDRGITQGRPTSVHCTLYSVHCKLQCTLNTLYTVHCTLCTVYCALYSVHLTLLTAGDKRWETGKPLEWTLGGICQGRRGGGGERGGMGGEGGEGRGGEERGGEGDHVILDFRTKRWRTW